MQTDGGSKRWVKGKGKGYSEGILIVLLY